MHWETKKIRVIHFIVIFALLLWSGTECGVSPRSACTGKSVPRGHGVLQSGLRRTPPLSGPSWNHLLLLTQVISTGGLLIKFLRTSQGWTIGEADYFLRLRGPGNYLILTCCSWLAPLLSHLFIHDPWSLPYPTSSPCLPPAVGLAVTPNLYRKASQLSQAWEWEKKKIQVQVA